MVASTLIVAVALIAVGGVFVRKANATSGYLFVAAGAFTLLTRCCCGGPSAERLISMGLDFDLLHVVTLVRGLAFGAESLVVAGLLAAALTMLAKGIPQSPDDNPG